jgi:hypothetical protein
MCLGEQTGRGWPVSDRGSSFAHSPDDEFFGTVAGHPFQPFVESICSDNGLVRSVAVRLAIYAFVLQLNPSIPIGKLITGSNMDGETFVRNCTASAHRYSHFGSAAAVARPALIVVRFGGIQG